MSDLLNIIGTSVVNLYNSSFFSVIKFLLGIYVAVLFVDIVLIVILRGIGYDIRIMLKGMDMPAVSKNKMRKRWAKIKERLESENPSQYKVAILEADIAIDKILSDMRYPGENLTERLEKIQPAQLPGYEDLKNAHNIRNQIIHEADFAVDKKRAKEIIAVYERLLENFELL